MSKNKFKQKNTIQSTYLVLAIFVALVLMGGLLCLSIFCPDFMFKLQSRTGLGDDASYGQYLFSRLTNQELYIKACTITFVTCECLSLLLSFPFIVYGFRVIFNYLTYGKWLKRYVYSQTEIISNFKSNKCKARVAMCVLTCNDVVPVTILQTMKQTYKNMDVWICDDSNKPDQIELIDSFAKKHGIHVYRRPNEHRQKYKSKVGNLFGFLAAHGSEYDYIFENDSSTLTTPHFVENSLCYFEAHKNEKVGAVIGLGSFYATQNLLSFLNAKFAQFNESNVIGSSVRFTGHPLFMHGWGALYSVKALEEMNLMKVSCPTDDMARGCWLNQHGWKTYLNPLDFTGKIGVRTLQGYKAQHLKWNGGDVFMFRTHLVTGKMKGSRNQMHAFFHSYPTVAASPIFALAWVAAILRLVTTFFYWNFTTLILAISFIAFFVLIFIFLLIGFKAHIPSILVLILIAIPEASLQLKGWWNNVYVGWIRRKWSAAAVTLKDVKPSTAKQKWRNCRNDLIALLIIIGCFIGITYLLKYFWPAYQNPYTVIILWLNLFPMVAVAPFLYVITVWLAEIPFKKGWDGKNEFPDFYKDDIRYRYLKDTDLWKEQNK